MFLKIAITTTIKKWHTETENRGEVSTSLQTMSSYSSTSKKPPARHSKSFQSATNRIYHASVRRTKSDAIVAVMRQMRRGCSRATQPGGFVDCMRISQNQSSTIVYSEFWIDKQVIKRKETTSTLHFYATQPIASSRNFGTFKEALHGYHPNTSAMGGPRLLTTCRHVSTREQAGKVYRWKSSSHARTTWRSTDKPECCLIYHLSDAMNTCEDRLMNRTK